MTAYMTFAADSELFLCRLRVLPDCSHVEDKHSLQTNQERRGTLPDFNRKAPNGRYSAYVPGDV